MMRGHCGHISSLSLPQEGLHQLPAPREAPLPAPGWNAMCLKSQHTQPRCDLPSYKQRSANVPPPPANTTARHGTVTSWHTRCLASPRSLSSGYATNATQSNTILFAWQHICELLQLWVSSHPWGPGTGHPRAPSQRGLSLLTVMSKPSSAPWPSLTAFTSSEAELGGDLVGG